ncbi:AfsR/SARP family transcriptional regulator, partial [Rhodococcus koreensis]
MDSGRENRLSAGIGSTRQAVVHLFNGPYVTFGPERVEVPEGSKRLLAFVALRHGCLERRYVAGCLWPFGDDNRAAGNLRSALWRMRGAGVDVIGADKWSLSLAETVDVDVDEVGQWAERVLSNTLVADDFVGIAARARALDLLPGCYDDWAITERERIRQRTLHALDALSRQLSAVGRYAEAVEAAMTAVGAEPLRESAQRVLIEAHLGEGNLGEARRAFLTYYQCVGRELGIHPSSELAAMVRLRPD